MHPSVREAWHAYSQPFEGRVHSLYVDVLGLVTTGVGNLCDPVHLALAFPWRLPDGALATKDEVLKQWNAVKAQSEFLKKRHWKYAADVTTMRLSDDDIDQIVADKLRTNEVELRKWFPEFDDAPADAQLGILSLAWAAGPAFARKFPNFTRSANDGKWAECAVSGTLRATGPDGTPNPGVIPRNHAQKLCFENAAFVTQHGLDPSTLHWPNRASDTISLPPPHEDDPPMSRIAQPDDLRAVALAAAESSRLDLLEDSLRDEPQFLPDEIPTKSDLPPKRA